MLTLFRTDAKLPDSFARSTSPYTTRKTPLLPFFLFLFVLFPLADIFNWTFFHPSSFVQTMPLTEEELNAQVAAHAASAAALEEAQVALAADQAAFAAAQLAIIPAAAGIPLPAGHVICTQCQRRFKPTHVLRPAFRCATAECDELWCFVCISDHKPAIAAIQEGPGASRGFLCPEHVPVPGPGFAAHEEARLLEEARIVAALAEEAQIAAAAAAAADAAAIAAGQPVLPALPVVPAQLDVAAALAAQTTVLNSMTQILAQLAGAQHVPPPHAPFGAHPVVAAPPPPPAPPGLGAGVGAPQGLVAGMGAPPAPPAPPGFGAPGAYTNPFTRVACPLLFRAKLHQHLGADPDFVALAEAKRSTKLGSIITDTGEVLQLGHPEKVRAMADWHPGHFTEYYCHLAAQALSTSPPDLSLVAEIQTWQREISQVQHHLNWPQTRWYMVNRRMSFIQGVASFSFGVPDSLLMQQARSLTSSSFRVIEEATPRSPHPCKNCQGTCPTLKACKAAKHKCTMLCTRCAESNHWTGDCKSVSAKATLFDEHKLAALLGK